MLAAHIKDTVDPERLTNFLHVFDLQSVSRAARRAHLSQPALSRQIRQLEEELGCVLFRRTGRGMIPTAEGVRLEGKVRPLLTQLAGLRQQFANAPLFGEVALGVSPSVGMAWTARALRQFVEAHPDVQPRILVSLSGGMVAALEQGRLDVGLLYGPMPSSRLVLQPLWEEPSLLICRPTEADALGGSVTCKQVLQHLLIVPSSRVGLRALLEEQAQRLGGRLKVKLEVDSMQLALELVKQGLGYLVLGESALPDITARRLAAIPIGRPALMRPAYLAAAPEALERPPVRALWQHLGEEGRRRPVSSPQAS